MAQSDLPQPRLDVRGAIDLSSLARTVTPPGSPNGLPAPGPYVEDVDEAGFPDLVQRSTQHPVVVVLWAPWSEASKQVAADLAALAAQDAGRWLLARIDSEAAPQVAAAFQAQSVPMAIAVLAGQPLPLFQGSAPRDQVRAVIDQVLTAAAANGLTGVVPATGDEPPAAPPEPELPPLHQAAYDAIERDDLDAATAAYEQALKENPRDDLARAGLAQVGLLTRTRDVDLATVRAAAAADPTDVDAQLAVADVDILGGQVADAFDRLLDVLRATSGPERERVRLRLVDLFEVVGSDDPRVMATRRAMASALY
ncbi:tetratricopeptide repeat protein [Cellulomonas sp. DKR-3]|uniref:Tetratricopeptide repeat protein n=1 Tax=Cellulomonas fulva TaxID=2835530 RepID=A0ABS5TU61_9CELL|nr:tetratricopeptide repeat protein [Cellulomonas fulva]MBT0992674.1 tetratricopeptide repeat protein [Cellulomonas fulva]